MYYETAEKLLEFIRKSPTAFHAVDTMKKTLAGNGFQELSEKELWSLTPGGNYMVTRNNSALIAFSIPEKAPYSFHIMASHSDSPTFKIKENPEITVEKAYVKLNVEKYGGMLMSPFSRTTTLPATERGRSNHGDISIPPYFSTFSFT